jgi:alpha-methylacyl-CoA racemase
MFPQIFAEIQIVDFSRLLPGPFASTLLQKMGAKVFCILPPNGDPLLGAYSPFKKLETNKQLQSLDLKTESGMNKAREIISKSPLLLEGFRPGTMERLGLGFEDVRKVRQDILYVSIVGYPKNHPQYLRGSHDINFLVDSGFYSLLYPDDSEIIPALQLADVLGGFYAVFQILMAWIERGSAPQPRHLRVSVIEGLQLLGDYLQHETTLPLLSMLAGGLARYRIYRSKDGKRIAVASLEAKFYENLLKALQLELKSGEGEEELAARIQEVFGRHTLEEWRRILKDVDACISFIPAREELFPS